MSHFRGSTFNDRNKLVISRFLFFFYYSIFNHLVFERDEYCQPFKFERENKDTHEQKEKYCLYNFFERGI